MLDGTVCTVLRPCENKIRSFILLKLDGKIYCCITCNEIILLFFHAYLALKSYAPSKTSLHVCLAFNKQTLIAEYVLTADEFNEKGT